MEVVDGCGEHAGLAGTGRADDEDEPIIAGHRAGPGALATVEAGVGDRGRRCWLVGLGVDRPGDDVFLLGEDVLARHLARGWFDQQRPTIRPTPPSTVGRWVEVDAAVEHDIGTDLERPRPAGRVVSGLRAGGPGECAQDVHPAPRRAPLGELRQHLSDRHRRRLGDMRAGRRADRVDEVDRVVADVFGFLVPP